MASQQMIDRLQPTVPGIPPSKKARLDSTNSETSEKLHELLGNLDDLPDELMTGFQDVGDLSVAAPQSGTAPQQLEAQGVPQHFTPPVGGGVPGAQAHMYTNSPRGVSPRYNSLNPTGGSVSPQPPVSTSGDPTPSMPPISGTPSHSATPGPAQAPVQGRPGDPMGIRMSPSVGPHAMHPGGGQSRVSMMNNTPPNMALGIHGNQAMMQQMGNPHPMSYQMVSQHPGNQHMGMIGMSQHGMVPDQYSMAGQPGMGPGHHMAQHGGQMMYPHMMRGSPQVNSYHSPGMPVRYQLAPRGSAMQNYPQVQMGMPPAGVHPGMSPAGVHPGMRPMGGMGAAPPNMVAPQGVGPQSNMGIPPGMGAQSGMVSSQGIGGAPPNMVAPQGVPALSLRPGTPAQQQQQGQQQPPQSQQDGLMAMDPSLRTSGGAADFRMASSQSQQPQNDFVSTFTSPQQQEQAQQQGQGQQDGLLGSQQSQVSVPTPQQIGGGDSQLPGLTQQQQLAMVQGGLGVQGGPTTDPEKRKLIQQQLVLLLHAHKCQRREREQQANGEYRQCTLPHCRTMKNVLTHMTECSAGRACAYPHCASSRQIITHWKNCQRQDCPVCLPLRHASLVHTAAHPNPPNMGMQQRMPSSNQGMGMPPYPRPIMHQLPPGPNNFQSMPDRQNPVGYNPSGPNNSSLFMETQSGIGLLREPSSLSYPIDIPTSTPGRPTQAWQQEVTLDVRQHLVRKLVEAIYPVQDPVALQDRRVASLIQYAMKVEKAMFEAAESKQQYYEFLAAKIYRIRKELEERRKMKSEMESTKIGPMVHNGSIDMMNPQRVPEEFPATPLHGLTTNSPHGPPNVELPAALNMNHSPTLASNADSERKPSPPSNPLPQSLPPTDIPSVKSIKCSPITSIKKEAPSEAPPPSEPAYNTITASTPLGGSVKLQAPSSVTSVEHLPPIQPLRPSSPAVKSEVTRTSSPANRMEAETTPSESSSSTQKQLKIKHDPALRKVFTKDELILALRPVYNAIYNQDPESFPFRIPVDPKALGIPDYFDIIKNPIDLSAIGKKLDEGLYANPWEFCKDVWLMFDNAWLYNKKTSRVYKFCTKLAEVFDSLIHDAMKSLGFCCGGRYTFHPQVLYCYGRPLCTIPRDSPYYGYQNRYVYCPKCFQEIPGDMVTVGDDPASRTVIPKSHFKELKNDVIEHEPMVACVHCGREMHQICVLHYDHIWSEGFQCNGCLKSKSVARRENKFTAKRLPVTKLSTFLEERVNGFLRTQGPGTSDVIIRVVSSSDKILDTRTMMRDRFQGDFPDSFPYRTKAMFAFEEIDGVEVCFFGMHVQEYGSESQAPNTRRVYISYLDSVHFFQPRHLRTVVYHQILIGYLEFCKNNGFTMAHIWACPPSEGDDYIFHCHPEEQKIPKPKRLIEWYKKMLDRGKIEKVIYDYKDICRYCADENITSVTEIPYFDGDFWPNVIEETIKELDQEREATEAATGELSQGRGGQKKLGKRSSSNSTSKKGGTKKATNLRTKSTKKGNLVSGGDDLAQKIAITMDKHKDVFFVVFFQPPQVLCASPLPATTDPDQLINCDLMDGRDAFLTLARERHWEFSSLRRAKFSSMTMLCELHNQGSDRFVYTCNNCRLHVETRYHCRECDDFDLCVNCYQSVGHFHQMDRLGLGLDMDDAQPQVPQNPVEARKQSIQKCIQYLLHACQCKDIHCKLPGCVKIKRILKHTRDCKLRQSGNCTLCKQFLILCYTHAKSCNEQSCPVPICARIKVNLREQRLQKRMRQERFMQQRMVNMEQFSSSTAAPPQGPAVPNNSAASPIAISSPQAAPQSTKVPPSPTSSKSPSTSTTPAANVTVTPTQNMIPVVSPATPLPNVGKGAGPVTPGGDTDALQMSVMGSLVRTSDHALTQPAGIPGDQAQPQNERLIGMLLDTPQPQTQYTDLPSLEKQLQMTRQDTPPQAMNLHQRTIMPNTMVREMYPHGGPPGYGQTALMQQQQQQQHQAMLARQQQQLQQQQQYQQMMRMNQQQQSYRLHQQGMMSVPGGGGGGGGGGGYHTMVANPQQQQQQTQLQQMLRQQPQYMAQSGAYQAMVGHPQQGPMGPPPQYPAATMRPLSMQQQQQQQQQQMGVYGSMQSRQMMSPAMQQQQQQQQQQMSVMQGHAHQYAQQMGPQMAMDPSLQADPSGYLYQQFTMNTNNNNCGGGGGGILMHDIQYMMPSNQPHSMYESTPQERLNDLAENL